MMIFVFCVDLNFALQSIIVKVSLKFGPFSLQSATVTLILRLFLFSFVYADLDVAYL